MNRRKTAANPPAVHSGSPNSRSLKHWLGGMVNNPTTGALSHDKVWANVAAAALTVKFLLNPDAPEWQWWAYGGMVGGYGLARRAIAAVQQSQQNKGD